ncbi:MAG: YdcF family protein, partial [Betaproteobacteria bacterium]|nr:YdcF family protein [Betaproteobacteria bacterium]
MTLDAPQLRPDCHVNVRKLLLASGRYTRWVAYLSLAVVTCAGIALITAGFWLVPGDDEVRPADVIVVLAGGYERSLYAADLYHRGHAKKIWVSRPALEPSKLRLEQYGIIIPSEEEIHRAILLHKNVSPDDLEFFGSHSLSTAEEARSMRERVGSAPLRLLIVTSPAHTRRAGIIFKEALTGTGATAQVVATPYENFDTYWWRDQNSARMVVLEIAKMIYFGVGGRFF